MNSSNRKAKLTKYNVTMSREVRFTAVLVVEARSVEEAEGMAEASVDNDPSSWVEDTVVCQSAKAKVIR